MKNFFFSLKQYYKSAPILITIEILLTTLPVGVLAGFITNAERLMINSVQNYVVGTIKIEGLVNSALVFSVLTLASIIFSGMLTPYLQEKISLKNELRFNKRILNKYKTIKYEYFEQEKMLDLFEKTSGASSYAERTFNRTLAIVQNVVAIVSSIVAMWIISPMFSVVAIVVGFAVFILNYIRARRAFKMWGMFGVERRKISKLNTLFYSPFNHTSRKAQAELRVFNTSEKMVDYVNKGVVENRKKIDNKEIFGRVCMHVAGFLMMAVEISIVIYIYVGLKNGTLDWPIGNIVVSLTGFATLISMFSQISSSLSGVVEDNRKIYFVRSFFKLEDEKVGTISSIPKNAVVEIKNVSFTYPGTTKEILHNVSFNINCGEHIAFVGENGSGKSTIIKLILGLYEPTSGEILVNGHKITDYTLSARQKLFGVQYQDFYEYSLKIREVVAMGNIGILNKDKEIERTLEGANIYSAIKSKNATLDTLVGKSFDEDSIEFSGGEKQRMSLATTLAFNHNHLVLDEPTAALDAKAENMMYEVFMGGIKDKGSLIVSHRLASAKISDRIIVFEKGRLVQDGSHNSLMKNKSGLYHKMFTAQAKLYKEGKEI